LRILGGVNLYEYVGGDPIGYVDESGERRYRRPTGPETGRDWKELLDALGNGLEPARDYDRLLQELRRYPSCRTVCPDPRYPNVCLRPPPKPTGGDVRLLPNGCHVVCYPEWKVPYR
jgi:hypothetical protein